MKIIVLLLSFLIITNLNAQEGTFEEHKIKCDDGIERPYILYTPKTAMGKKDLPLLIYLHGAISNKNLKKDPLAYMKKSQLVQLADEGAFLLLFAYGQKGATWFDPTGVNMVLNEIQAVQQNYPIHPDKIFLSGFSDGASGVYYMAATQPSIFAGFIAMNGHLRVSTKLGRSQLYWENINHKPFYIINTKEDALYPSAEISPIIEKFKTVHTKIQYKDLEGNHHMGYLAEEKKSIIEFIKTNQKTPLSNVSLETSDLQSNRVDWLSITALATTQEAQDWHTVPSLKLFNSKAYFGLKFDYQYQGEGLKVNGFKTDTAMAIDMGVQVGDVILMMENDSMKSPYSPYFYQTKKKAGEKTNLTILREQQPMKLEGQFRKGYYYELFNYKKPSGKVHASLKGKTLTIKASRVTKIAIDFEQFPIEISKKLIIKINQTRYKLNKAACKGKVEFTTS